MKLVILAVGRGRNMPEAALAGSWMSRIHGGGDIIEVESKLPAGLTGSRMRATACCAILIPAHPLLPATRAGVTPPPNNWPK